MQGAGEQALIGVETAPASPLSAWHGNQTIQCSSQRGMDAADWWDGGRSTHLDILPALKDGDS